MHSIVVEIMASGRTQLPLCKVVSQRPKRQMYIEHEHALALRSRVPFCVANVVLLRPVDMLGAAVSTRTDAGAGAAVGSFVSVVHSGSVGGASCNDGFDTELFRRIFAQHPTKPTVSESAGNSRSRADTIEPSGPFLATTTSALGSSVAAGALGRSSSSSSSPVGGKSLNSAVSRLPPAGRPSGSLSPWPAAPMPPAAMPSAPMSAADEPLGGTPSRPPLNDDDDSVSMDLDVDVGEGGNDDKITIVAPAAAPTNTEQDSAATGSMASGFWLALPGHLAAQVCC